MKKYVYVVCEHFVEYGEEHFNLWVFDSLYKAQSHLAAFAYNCKPAIYYLASVKGYKLG